MNKYAKWSEHHIINTYKVDKDDEDHKEEEEDMDKKEEQDEDFFLQKFLE